LAAEVFLFSALDALDALDSFCGTKLAVFSGQGTGNLRVAVLPHL